MRVRRAIAIVLDGCGIGAAPDAHSYGDASADTLGHTAAAVGSLSIPHLAHLGLGNIRPLAGIAAAADPKAAYGCMKPASAGKDSAIGHWEITGLRTEEAFRVFAEGFPNALIAPFRRATGRDVLCNRPASGTQVIDDYGEAHLTTGHWIVYTSADSVFQIAAHEDVVPLEELYSACGKARELCNSYRIGRVIARPFVGKPGQFQRTYGRRDFGLPPSGTTLLDALALAGLPVVGIGKIGDLFGERGLSEVIHTAGNDDGLQKTLDCMGRVDHGFIFVNLIDFDTRFGHRRDPVGFASALQAFDAFLPRLVEALRPTDLLFITADHGNDPTYSGFDHTREKVPLLVFCPDGCTAVDLGLRDSFGDIGATIADALQVDFEGCGRSFYEALR